MCACFSLALGSELIFSLREQSLHRGAGATASTSSWNSYSSFVLEDSQAASGRHVATWKHLTFDFGLCV